MLIENLYFTTSMTVILSYYYNYYNIIYVIFKLVIIIIYTVKSHIFYNKYVPRVLDKFSN